MQVDVGELAFVYEYEPDINAKKENSRPEMPLNPDFNQTGVKWVKLSELNSINLYPDVKAQLIQYAAYRTTIPLLE